MIKLENQPDSQAHFSLVMIDHPTSGRLRQLDDVVIPLYFAFKRLGYKVEILRHMLNSHSVNVLFGAHNDPHLKGFDLPENSIFYNLEQLTADNSRWNGEKYLHLLKNYHCWDYSLRNREYLAEINIKSEFLPIGYVPEMTRLSPDICQDRGVVFYGEPSARRRKILDGLSHRGADLNLPSGGLYGRDRDMAIAESKVCLNIHHYTPATLEYARLGYLWANRRPVVSECGPDTEIYPALEQACAFSGYEHLVPVVMEILADDKKRIKQGEAGFEAFSSISLEKELERLVGRRSVHGTGADLSYEPRPNHMHIGSGRDFKNGALNVDLAAHCRPDLVIDISQPLNFDKKYPTERFGEIVLSRESFTKITAFEVLEHVADLPQTMSNLLELLDDEGILELSVPYEFSTGAWQDPTHIRALNENSWKYYTTDAWYLGWREKRFELIDLSLILSKMGGKMLARGASRKKLCRTPRAVDGMRVILQKRSATEDEKKVYDRMFRSLYDHPVINWTLEDDSAADLYALQSQAFSSPGKWWRMRLNLFFTNFAYRFFKFMAVMGIKKPQQAHLKKKRNLLRNILKMR